VVAIAKSVLKRLDEEQWFSGINLKHGIERTYPKVAISTIV
jgi:hypothetical protein